MANGLSPGGLEEQSEYFDATDNPVLRDKRHECDDEDSGVDNASQILRESSVSYPLLSSSSSGLLNCGVADESGARGRQDIENSGRSGRPTSGQVHVVVGRPDARPATAQTGRKVRDRPQPTQPPFQTSLQQR